jgi:competence transcription factor ComK
VRYTNQPNVSENKTITIKMMFKSIRTMWRNGIYFESETQNQRITISKNEQEAIVETTESVTITHNGMLLEKTTGFSIVTVKLTEGRLLITDTEIRGEG